MRSSSIMPQLLSIIVTSIFLFIIHLVTTIDICFTLFDYGHSFIMYFSTSLADYVLLVSNSINDYLPLDSMSIEGAQNHTSSSRSFSDSSWWERLFREDRYSITRNDGRPAVVYLSVAHTVLHYLPIVGAPGITIGLFRIIRRHPNYAHMDPFQLFFRCVGATGLAMTVYAGATRILPPLGTVRGEGVLRVLRVPLNNTEGFVRNDVNVSIQETLDKARISSGTPEEISSDVPTDTIESISLVTEVPTVPSNTLSTSVLDAQPEAYQDVPNVTNLEELNPPIEQVCAVPVTRYTNLDDPVVQDLEDLTVPTVPVENRDISPVNLQSEGAMSSNYDFHGMENNNLSADELFYSLDVSCIFSYLLSTLNSLWVIFSDSPQFISLKFQEVISSLNEMELLSENLSRVTNIVDIMAISILLAVISFTILQFVGIFKDTQKPDDSKGFNIIDTLYIFFKVITVSLLFAFVVEFFTLLPYFT